MKKSARRRPRPRKIIHAPPGTAPGAIEVRSDALRPDIRCFVISPSEASEKELHSVQEIRSLLAAEKGKVFWVDIRGFGSRQFLEDLADGFGIHRLQMEDVVNAYQRPKAEDLPGHLFLVSRAVKAAENGLSDDQVSMFLSEDFVLTVQEKYEDLLGPVRERIRSGKGNIRSQGADYIAYMIMDTLVDNFFPILERMGERLDDLEEELLYKPSRAALDRLLAVKRELILLRRTVWRERDKINDILRSEFPCVRNSTKIFFRDTYDHCIQLLDLVESCREVTATLMDVYHSTVSNRMNQVMKVLTIISTIFIPLTFIVGIYGMNFAPKDPVTGAPLPNNMPELYSPNGYAEVLIAMAVIVLLQLVFFYKKGWLSRS
jgi:magnesium transporter